MREEKIDWWNSLTLRWDPEFFRPGFGSDEKINYQPLPKSKVGEKGKGRKKTGKKGKKEKAKERDRESETDGERDRKREREIEIEKERGER